jgi:transitional endoplasmic reticulum ATPase
MGQGRSAITATREWLEQQASTLLFFSAFFMSIYWLGVLAYKAVMGPPVTFSYSPELAAETIPAFYLAGILALSAVYSIVQRWITGKAMAVTLFTFAPWLLALSVLLVVGWTYFGRPAGGSYVPLAALLVLSGWGTYVTRWGFLSPHPQRDRQQRGGGTGSEADAGPARIEHPKRRFADIHGNEAVKARIKEAATAITAKRGPNAKIRNGILFHGLPGNGKTAFAEALAGELGLPLLQLSYAEVASQWVGEKSARVREAFNQARRMQPCVLFIDEIESFLESRDSGRGDGVKEDRDLVNAMLTLMVDIRKDKVILVAATNHLDRLDAAGIREGRFDFKVEITPPDLVARQGLLRMGIKENLQGVAVGKSVVESVAQRWNGFSSKRILAVTEELVSYLGGRREAGFDDFMGALRQLQGQRGHIPENVKPLDELIFSDTTRGMLDQIVGRMADPEHTAKHGGTLPTGVLFWGSPGTGKTAACKALAKKLEWAYLPTTGADLVRDPKQLEALFAKAKDLRPTIIFIDEADELLRSREYSPSTEATNKLLTLMDGVGDRVPDVVWIAATNHPEQIDPALLRGGRFTEKVRFDLPSTADVSRYVQTWCEKRSVKLESGFTPTELAGLMGEVSIANAEAIVQAALNRAIVRRQSPVVVTRADVEQALNLVEGEKAG